MAFPEIELMLAECCTVSSAITYYRGNQSQLARDLNITRTTMSAYIKKNPDKLIRVIRHEGGSISHFELF